MAVTAMDTGQPSDPEASDDLSTASVRTMVNLMLGAKHSGALLEKNEHIRCIHEGMTSEDQELLAGFWILVARREKRLGGPKKRCTAQKMLAAIERVTHLAYRGRVLKKLNKEQLRVSCPRSPWTSGASYARRRGTLRKSMAQPGGVFERPAV